MAIRRQGWTVEWDDDGSVPVADLTKLYTGESVFYDNPGATNSLTSRNRTKDDQFIVLQYYGSTPGRTNTTESELDDPNDWSPGTYMQYKVGTTYYFENPDGIKNDGIAG